MRTSDNSEEKTEQSIVYRCDYHRGEDHRPQRVGCGQGREYHRDFGGTWLGAGM